MYAGYVLCAFSIIITTPTCFFSVGYVHNIHISSTVLVAKFNIGLAEDNAKHIRTLG